MLHDMLLSASFAILGAVAGLLSEGIEGIEFSLRRWVLIVMLSMSIGVAAGEVIGDTVAGRGAYIRLVGLAGSVIVYKLRISLDDIVEAAIQRIVDRLKKKPLSPK